MTWIESVILGIVQGLTEFLPVSSSGHLIIFKEFFDVNTGGTTFEVMVHAGTVLSTIVVFRKDIRDLLKGFFAFKYSPQMGFVINILVSTLPLVLVYMLCKDFIDTLYEPPYNIMIVGYALVATALLLTLTHFVKSSNKPVNMQNAFIIGIAQSVALLPGLSRSGTTISTGLLLGCRREDVAR
ncbi:MAG: undecaprenyl-diphosphate phosphatase, partial [Rikenellaceae bacterium]|nr:undecaprenyl-diphosphate phosphatase [Rikenellaceae bacterium]